MDRVRVILGDTDNTPYGGGTWASRGAGIGGEAALQAAKILRGNILDVAAAILQSQPAELDIVDGARSSTLGRHGAHRARASWRASSISAPTRCRRASSPN